MPDNDEETEQSEQDKPELDGVSGFDINFKEIQDESTQKAVKQLLDEREAMKSEMKEVRDVLKQMNKREQQKQFEQARSEKMSKLRDIDPRLADKHKDESDLDKIDLLIDTAQSFNSNFAEYSKEKNKDAEPQLMGYVDPMTGKLV